MTLRAYLTEMIGTFLFVLVCAATVCAAHLAAANNVLAVGLVGIAVAQGCALAALLHVTTRVSDGCLNPAVTLALWVTRRFDGGRAVALIIVQLVGASFAGGLIAFSFPQSTLESAYVGTPHLRAFIQDGGTIGPGDWLIGSLVEAALTLLVTLTIMTMVLEAGRPRWGPAVAGAALTAVVLAGYWITGAAVNPARWLGCAIWQRNVSNLASLSLFQDHLVYWMGPTIGALAAALIYTEWLKPDRKKG